MAVKLRLRREGTKKKSHFRVVAADTRAPRDGRFLEIIGEYHPMENPSGIRLDPDRTLHWLRNGARPTDTVQKLLYLSGIWEQFRPGTTPDDIEIDESLARPAGVPATTPDGEDAGAESEETESDETESPESESGETESAEAEFDESESAEAESDDDTGADEGAAGQADAAEAGSEQAESAERGSEQAEDAAGESAEADTADEDDDTTAEDDTEETA